VKGEVNLPTASDYSTFVSAEKLGSSHSCPHLGETKGGRAEGIKTMEHDCVKAVPVHYSDLYSKPFGARGAVFGTLLLMCLILLSQLCTTVYGQQNSNATQVKAPESLIKSGDPKSPVDPPKNSTAGGVITPIDKIALLIPYIGLAATILVSTGATGIHVKRRKEKQ